jgi:predicted nucleotidyltransferase
MIGVDPQTELAIRAFLHRISSRYEVVGARLYGSRARKTHASDSDADLAVFLKGAPGDVLEVGVDMAGVAFDAMLDTEVLVAPLPIWEDDWSHPEKYSNPRLLENIRSEGIPV